MSFYHEYDAKGSHRLVSAEPVGRIVFSPWTSYTILASLTIGQTQYICATEFWEGTFKADEVYEISSEGPATVTLSQSAEEESLEEV